MSTRAALILLLLLSACLGGCVASAVDHSLYRPDKPVAAVIPRDVALAQLNKYFDATDEGLSHFGMPPLPYETIVKFELGPIRGGGYLLLVGDVKGSLIARKPLESIDEGRKVLECLISLGARIQR